MLSKLRPHRNKLILIYGIAFMSLIACIWVGDRKSWGEIDWLDVLGEGGSSIAIAIWMILILGSRPAGRVTNLLTLGLGFMFIAMWQDNIDEFIRIPAEQWWDHWLESAAMPFGIGLLTYGLFHWHDEQLAVNQQLQKRENLFREHRYLDTLTQLGRVDYLKEHIQRLRSEYPDAEMSLIMLEIEQFSLFSRQYGHRESDRLLHEIAEILLLNLRRQDVICRYAGDRFSVVLMDTSPERSLQIAEELRLAIQHFSFKTKDGDSCPQSICAGVVCTNKDQTTSDILANANQALNSAREQHCCYLAA